MNQSQESSVTVLNSLVVDIEDLSYFLNKEGLIHFPVDKIPQKVTRAIVRNHREEANNLADGTTQIRVTDIRAWKNQYGDSVHVGDYVLETEDRLRNDPILVIEEQEDGRLSLVVKRILLKSLRITTIAATLARGMESRKFKQCLKELANIQNIPEDELRKQIRWQIERLMVKASV